MIDGVAVMRGKRRDDQGTNSSSNSTKRGTGAAGQNYARTEESEPARHAHSCRHRQSGRPTLHEVWQERDADDDRRCTHRARDPAGRPVCAPPSHHTRPVVARATTATRVKSHPIEPS